MAGSLIMFNATHASARQNLPRIRPPALVEASLTILNRTFTTQIREGASAEQLIEQIARENGGEVLKKYYPEFKTWEITSVRIGDVALVKSTESGIHFSLGEAGIPITVTEGEGIVFPNAEEMRIGKNTRNIALWTTSANFDPGSIRDLDDIYGTKGGITLSADARDEVSKAHGGIRSGGNIVLEDNILVLNKDTGEVLTVSQHAARESVQPQPALPLVPAMAPQAPFPGPNPEPPRLSLPDDGSRFRVPCLNICIFDGRLADQVKIQFNPVIGQAFDAIAPQARELQKLPETLRMPKIAFCRLVFKQQKQDGDSPQPPSSQKAPQPPADAAKPARSQPDNGAAAAPSSGGAGACSLNPSSKMETLRPRASRLPVQNTLRTGPEIPHGEILRAWHLPRQEPLDLGTAESVARVRNPDRNASVPEKKACGKKARKASQGPSPSQRKRKDKLLKQRQKRDKGKDREKRKARPGLPFGKKAEQTRRRRRAGAHPADSRKKTKMGAKNQGSLPVRAFARNPRRGRPRSLKAQRPLPEKTVLGTKEKRTSIRRREKPMMAKTAGKARNRINALHEAPGANNPSRRKKKMPKHFLFEMLGLYWNRRGRKLRRKKKSAA